MTRCTCLWCWPASGPPQAFFQDDGTSFCITNLGASDDEALAADDAIDAMIEWSDGVGVEPPAGWRRAL